MFEGGDTMKKAITGEIYGLIALGAFLCLVPSVGLGDCNISIGATTYPSIMAAVSAAAFGNTINVSGTCTEIVQILANKSGITLNGGGTATIICQSPIPSPVCAAAPGIVITGTQIFISGFNITGGIAGIQVAQGAVATINGNNIYGTQRNGIVVAMNSFATIVNNTIHDTGLNPNYPNPTGIEVSDNASAWIGVSRPTDTVASPNIIRDNWNGIRVRRSASAVIVGNDIINNADDGIRVLEGSVADIAGNLIDGNGQNGIFVSQGSGVKLADDDSGTPIFNLPNSGTNGDKGLSCSIGGYVDGVLGDLDGLHGAVRISKGCFNSLEK
jgi:nitrous oxidase accessory protein NosD